MQLAAETLGESAEVVCYDDRCEDPDTLIARAKDAQIVVVSNIPFGRDVISQCPALKMLCIAFTGVDHVDLEQCRARGITVCNCAGYSTEAVADLVFGMTLCLARSLPQCDAAARSGGTKAGLVGFELAGRTFGIVGYGAIGAQVGTIAKAFGCRVLACSRTEKQVEGVEFVPLDTLLQQSDVVSLHVPANAETRHMIGARELSLMKPTALLINCARGTVVDSDALGDALTRGQIAGAGIDVLESEPPFAADHPLLRAPHTILTPHVAFATEQSMEKRAAIVFDNIAAFLGGKPKNVIC
ncbi:MAG: NAD(P)-dependent oxidoreductase [Oscillospiraceae bacterium]|nr:NAD(P)-dependent oxidoreductase [Oscillospiraceae bacterium]